MNHHMIIVSFTILIPLTTEESDSSALMNHNRQNTTSLCVQVTAAVHPAVPCMQNGPNRRGGGLKVPRGDMARHATAAIAFLGDGGDLCDTSVFNFPFHDLVTSFVLM